MCILMDNCCFCLDLEAGARAIALVEAVLATPSFVHGIATVSVPLLAAGLLLFTTSWVLLDGAMLERRGLLLGWLVSGIFKMTLAFGLAILCARIAAGDAGIVNIDADSVGSRVLDVIHSSVTCCTILSREDHGSLFLITYSITFFLMGFMYMYFFAVVYSFRRKIGDVRQEEEEEMKRKEKKRSSSKKSKRLFHHNHDLPFGESRQDYL